MTTAHSTERLIPGPDGRPGAAWIALFLMVLALGTALRLANHNVTNPTPDEYAYRNYAEQVLHGSINTPRLLVEEYNAHKERWIYPAPIRIGYYYLLAAAMKCSGAPAGQAGVAVSSLFSIIQFLFVAIIGLRFFDRWTVLIALALMSVCPMDLAIARRVWQDGVVGCVGLMLFYFCMEASLRSGKKIWLALFWLTGIFFLLLKETAAPVFGFYCLWLTGACWFGKCSFKQCAAIAGGCVLTGLLSFVILAVLSGGIPNIIAVLQHSKQTMPFNPYAVNFQNGPWYSHPLGWWVLSPVSATLCFLVVAGWLLPGQPLRRLVALDDAQCRAVWAMVLSIVLVITMVTLPSHLMNLRYCSLIYGIAYLLSGFGLRCLQALCKSNLARPRNRLASIAVAAIIAGTMLADFLTFDQVFIKAGMDDLAIVRLINGSFSRAQDR